MTDIRYDNLDWNQLWKAAKQRKSWKSKKVNDWNERADSFAKRTANSIYVQQVIDSLAPQADWTLLDVGCGPGTLGLPLAEKVAQVTGLDFSPRMLEIFEQRRSALHLNNIALQQLAWDDDWEAAGVGPHDVVLASRSMAVKDLRKSLEKLTRMALQRVVVTDKVRHGPFDPDAFTAVGRKLENGPDYIYTVNVLYQMGYLPEVQYIRLEETMTYESFDDAFTSYAWMFQEMNNEEQGRLLQYLRTITTEENGRILLHRRTPPTWAYISWTP
ncbi:MAG: SAM-dependent methyltransferase [Desulfobulbus propionicus]|nr:MAG: SAM-dependent methyltransferase [Desulfobulbus propionicus]